MATGIEADDMERGLAKIDAVNRGATWLVTHDDPPVRNTPVCLLRGEADHLINFEAFQQAHAGN